MFETKEQTRTALKDPVPSLEKLLQVEQGFRTLVEALPDAILVHSQDKIVFVNPSCIRLLAAAGPAQLLGKDIAEFIRPDYLSAIKNRIWDCYSTGKASPPIEAIAVAC